MIRPARPEDMPAIAARLSARPEATMFLAANLNRGIDGFWVAGEPISDVIQLSEEGFFLTAAPALPETGWAELRERLSGRDCHGVNGRPELVAAALDGLGLAAHPAALDRIEPLFTLDLDRLTVPEGTTRLRRMAVDDLPGLTPWRAAYLNETMAGIPGTGAQAMAHEQLLALIAAGRARVLAQNGAPRAICAFNAALPDRVQLGGVYTPPEFRGQGHARRAVALHLAEARAKGVRHAVLFAASPAAARAYRAIGFTPDGGYRLVLFTPAARIGG